MTICANVVILVLDFYQLRFKINTFSFQFLFQNYPCKCSTVGLFIAILNKQTISG